MPNDKNSNMGIKTTRTKFSTGSCQKSHGIRKTRKITLKNKIKVNKKIINNDNSFDRPVAEQKHLVFKM